VDGCSALAIPPGYQAVLHEAAKATAALVVDEPLSFRAADEFDCHWVLPVDDFSLDAATAAAIKDSLFVGVLQNWCSISLTSEDVEP
jgi:hypothetical protein